MRPWSSVALRVRGRRFRWRVIGRGVDPVGEGGPEPRRSLSWCRSAGSAGEGGFDAGFGDEGGEDAGGGGEVFAGARVAEKVVAGHVEGFGEADDGVRGGGDVAVFVAADLAGVGADLGGEVGL